MKHSSLVFFLFIEALLILICSFEWYLAWRERRQFRTWVAALMVAICISVLLLVLSSPYVLR